MLESRTELGKTGKLERLAKLGDEKKRAIAKKARAAIALIQSKKDEIARDFYAIGCALVALDDKAVIAALGHNEAFDLMHEGKSIRAIVEYA